MADTPPFRNRPNLHLSLTSLAGLSMSSSQSSPGTTPFNTTTHSPVHPVDLKIPAPQAGTPWFVPWRSSAIYSRYGPSRPRRLFSGRALLLGAVIFGLIYWWSSGGQENFEVAKLRSSSLRQELFAPEITRDLQFNPASNPKIHVRPSPFNTSHRTRSKLSGL